MDVNHAAFVPQRGAKVVKTRLTCVNRVFLGSIISDRCTPYHNVTSYFASLRIASRHIISHHIKPHMNQITSSYCIISHHVRSYRITLHHITSHNIMSHHVTSHNITSHRISDIISHISYIIHQVSYNT